MRDRVNAFLRGEGPDPRSLPFEAYEGTDLSTVWEPIGGVRGSPPQASGSQESNGPP